MRIWHFCCLRRPSYLDLFGKWWTQRCMQGEIRIRICNLASLLTSGSPAGRSRIRAFSETSRPPHMQLFGASYKILPRSRVTTVEKEERLYGQLKNDSSETLQRTQVNVHRFEGERQASSQTGPCTKVEPRKDGTKIALAVDDLARVVLLVPQRRLEVPRLCLLLPELGRQALDLPARRRALCLVDRAGSVDLSLLLLELLRLQLVDEALGFPGAHLPPNCCAVDAGQAVRHGLDARCQGIDLRKKRGMNGRDWSCPLLGERLYRATCLLGHLGLFFLGFCPQVLPLFSVCFRFHHLMCKNDHFWQNANSGLPLGARLNLIAYFR